MAGMALAAMLESRPGIYGGGWLLKLPGLTDDMSCTLVVDRHSDPHVSHRVQWKVLATGGRTMAGDTDNQKPERAGVWPTEIALWRTHQAFS